MTQTATSLDPASFPTIDNPGGGDCGFYAFAVALMLIPKDRRPEPLVRFLETNAPLWDRLFSELSQLPSSYKHHNISEDYGPLQLQLRSYLKACLTRELNAICSYDLSRVLVQDYSSFYMYFLWGHAVNPVPPSRAREYTPEHLVSETRRERKENILTSVSGNASKFIAIGETLKKLLVNIGLSKNDESDPYFENFIYPSLIKKHHKEIRECLDCYLRSDYLAVQKDLDTLKCLLLEEEFSVLILKDREQTSSVDDADNTIFIQNLGDFHWVTKVAPKAPTTTKSAEITPPIKVLSKDTNSTPNENVPSQGMTDTPPPVPASVPVTENLSKDTNGSGLLSKPTAEPSLTDNIERLGAQIEEDRTKLTIQIELQQTLKQILVLELEKNDIEKKPKSDPPSTELTTIQEKLLKANNRKEYLSNCLENPNKYSSGYQDDIDNISQCKTLAASLGVELPNNFDSRDKSQQRNLKQHLEKAKAIRSRIDKLENNENKESLNRQFVVILNALVNLENYPKAYDPISNFRDNVIGKLEKWKKIFSSINRLFSIDIKNKVLELENDVRKNLYRQILEHLICEKEKFDVCGRKLKQYGKNPESFEYICLDLQRQHLEENINILKGVLFDGSGHGLSAIPGADEIQQILREFENRNSSTGFYDFIKPHENKILELIDRQSMKYASSSSWLESMKFYGSRAIVGAAVVDLGIYLGSSVDCLQTALGLASPLGVYIFMGIAAAIVVAVIAYLINEYQSSTAPSDEEPVLGS